MRLFLHGGGTASRFWQGLAVLEKALKTGRLGVKRKMRRDYRMGAFLAAEFR
jgi:hypothetical protein